jgi:hypothetical protein
VSKSASLRTERQFVTSDQRGTFAADWLGYDWQLRPGVPFTASYQRRDEIAQPTFASSSAQDAASRPQP